MLEYLANFNTDGTLSFNLIEQSIPQGYRPVTTVYLPFVQTSGANVIGHGVYGYLPTVRAICLLQNRGLLSTVER